MYKMVEQRQISFFDFNQSCGFQLDEHNEWVRLANALDWNSIEMTYSALFPSQKGRPAKSLRIALGALIIQKRGQFSDRALVAQIAQNPYFQFFLGLDKFQQTCPFRPSSLLLFRKRFSQEFLMKINERFLATAAPTPEHAVSDHAPSASAAKADCSANAGTAIIDASCSPSNIKYPQDFVLLNQAREALEEMIDALHAAVPGEKIPRTYRVVLHKAYLTAAKKRKRTVKMTRSLIRRLLCALNRDMRYIEDYKMRGIQLPDKYTEKYRIIAELYRQQKEMFDNKTHRVEHRIVSLSQPFIRPIVRGKAKAPVEFGAKYDVSIDEKGHARLEKVSFEPYNESTIFKDVIERYRARTGHYPARVLVDQIYRTRENRRYCTELGIRISGPRLGRPANDEKLSQIASQDNIDRIEIERFFSLEKRCNGAALMMTKLSETTLASIALSIFVTNLFAIPRGKNFLLYFVDSEENYGCVLFLEFDDASSSLC